MSTMQLCKDFNLCMHVLETTILYNTEMKKHIYILAIIALTGFIGSCSDEADPVIETELLEEVANANNEGIEVSVLAATPLFVGYNSISIELANTSDNSSITDATVSIMPMMHMMDMSHSCPVTNKTATINENGKYTFDVVFVMPSGDMGSWEITFNIEQNGTTKEVTVPVTVVQPDETKLISFVSQMDDMTKYFVALIGPNEPAVGENDLEIAVFKKETMMSWPAVEGMSFELEPWMTSMDHGSPNNIAPADMGDGYYMGKVNFTMTGDWEIRLTMKDGEQVIGEPVFNLTFQ